MTELVRTKHLTEEEWRQWRNQGIGGSDAAVIMGVNPWKSQMDLWLEKTGEFSEDIDNEAMHWGRTLEDIVAREWSQRTGKKIRRRNAILRHPDHAWMLANVDRLVINERAGLEVKTTNAFYQDDGSVPPHYYAQVQHYMAVTGLDLWYVAVLVGGQRLVSYEVPRNEEYIDALIELEWEFWQLVQTKAPPELDGSEASSKVVSRMYPHAKEEETQLPGDAFSLVQQYEEAAEEERAAKLRKDEAANKLKAMLGEAEKGFVYDRKVSWTNVESTRFDSKEFAKNEPDLYEKYAKKSNYRRFSIK